MSEGKADHNSAEKKEKVKTTGPIHNAKYKESLCEKYTKTGTCPYKEKCQFAHGEAELEKWRRRKLQQSNKNNNTQRENGNNVAGRNSAKQMNNNNTPSEDKTNGGSGGGGSFQQQPPPPRYQPQQPQYGGSPFGERNHQPPPPPQMGMVNSHHQIQYSPFPTQSPMVLRTSAYALSSPPSIVNNSNNGSNNNSPWYSPLPSSFLTTPSSTTSSFASPPQQQQQQYNHHQGKSSFMFPPVHYREFDLSSPDKYHISASPNGEFASFISPPVEAMTNKSMILSPPGFGGSVVTSAATAAAAAAANGVTPPSSSSLSAMNNSNNNNNNVPNSNNNMAASSNITSSNHHHARHRSSIVSFDGESVLGTLSDKKSSASSFAEDGMPGATSSGNYEQGLSKDYNRSLSFPTLSIPPDEIKKPWDHLKDIVLPPSPVGARTPYRRSGSLESPYFPKKTLGEDGKSKQRVTELQAMRELDEFVDEFVEEQHPRVLPRVDDEGLRALKGLNI